MDSVPKASLSWTMQALRQPIAVFGLNGSAMGPRIPWGTDPGQISTGLHL
jgi:hypothetical protein